MPEKVWNIQNVALFRFLVSLFSSTVTCFYPVSDWPAECQACLPTQSDHRWASCETFARLVPSGFQSSRSGQRYFVAKTMYPTWKGVIKAHYGWSQVHKCWHHPNHPHYLLIEGLYKPEKKRKSIPYKSLRWLKCSLKKFFTTVGLVWSSHINFINPPIAIQ